MANLEELGHHVIDGARKSHRIAARDIEARIYVTNKLSARSALRSGSVDAEEAIVSEMSQIVSRKVFEPVDYNELEDSINASAIQSSMFVVKTFDESGNYVKTKSRLVAGGDCQDKPYTVLFRLLLLVKKLS